VDEFLRTVAEPELGKTLRVNDRDAWPVEPEGDYDSIILVDVLAAFDDPQPALVQCRSWLTPTGRILATFPCVPALATSTVQSGFTEASVRALLTATFPDAAVSIETHGNLLTCIAAVAGVADDTLTAADIVDADPWQPLLVTARVELGRDGRSDGIARFRSTRRIRDRGVVLAYHRVAELAPDVHGLCVPPDRFRQHMELLRERFSPVSLTDLVEGVNDRDLPHRSVCVTFDDGYADNFLVASPILSELEIPATLFFNSETLDGSEPWWDTIERVLLAEAELPDQLRVQTRGLVLDLPTVTDAERRHALFALHGSLLELDVEERRNVVESVSAWAGNSLPPRDSHRLMTAEEIRELAQRPNHEIGAHTVHHLMLTKYATDVRYQELVDNRNVLEALSGRPVSALSYPYGATDSVTADIVHELGFSYALTVESGAVTQDSDPLRLPRLEIEPPRAHDFELEITQIFAKA
jgi:peptidoglycan/xylan/chitin deacetylase (PgdA/CDA1 family)